MNLNSFIKELELLNIEVTEEKLKMLEIYYEYLIEENEKINLTRIISKEDVYLKHFYDSLTINKIIDLNNYNTLCDIGSGAGFPGIVLKIFYPHLKITLIDSINKKVDFLNRLINKLDLKEIKAINVRIEEHNEKYDVITARAVARLNILVELAIPKINLKGHFIALKARAEDEIKEINNALKELDSQIEEIINFNLPLENSERTLIKIKKLKHTNKKYPRKFDKIVKNPL